MARFLQQTKTLWVYDRETDNLMWACRWHQLTYREQDLLTDIYDSPNEETTSNNTEPLKKTK
jgi:hypothetical protein